MKRIYGLMLGILLLAWTGAVCQAVQEDAGTNSPFEMGAGARALAMAGAYTAVADDVSAIFWNPGGLAQLQQAEVTAMHISLFYDTPYDFFGAAYPLLDWGTFAVGTARIATDGIVLRDEQAHLIGNGTGSLDLREYLFGYGREIAWNIRAGAVVKIDQERLLGDSDNGVGLDLGVHYTFPKNTANITGFNWEDLSLGVAVQNLMGSQLRLGEVADVLPMHTQAGLAYTYRTHDSLKQRILVSGSWDKSTWRTSDLAVGVEYSLLDLFALRCGVSSSAWTLGGGVVYSGFSLDYAMAAEELGLTHRFSLSYRFGAQVAEQKNERDKKRQAEVGKEAEAQAQAAVDKAKQDMEKALQAAERRHRREKDAILAEQKQLLDTEILHQQEQAKAQAKAQVADEYFKAFHYFQGVKDYMAQRYPEALVEFQTVEKYDANYLELPLYLARTQQRIKGKIEFMSPVNYTLYFQGIDLYVAEKFSAAIATWEKILATEPNNLLVLRNIDEAKERIAKLKAVKKQVDEEEKQSTPPAPAQDQKTPETKPR